MQVKTALTKHQVDTRLLPENVLYCESKLFESRFRHSYTLPRRISNELLVNSHCAEVAALQKDYITKVKASYRTFRENYRGTIDADAALGSVFDNMETMDVEEGKQMCAACGKFVTRVKKHLATTHPTLMENKNIEEFVLRLSKSQQKKDDKPNSVRIFSYITILCLAIV